VQFDPHGFGSVNQGLMECETPNSQAMTVAKEAFCERGVGEIFLQIANAIKALAFRYFYADSF
jgi:hypothetical protein